MKGQTTNKDSIPTFCFSDPRKSTLSNPKIKTHFKALSRFQICVVDSYIFENSSSPPDTTSLSKLRLTSPSSFLADPAAAAAPPFTLRDGVDDRGVRGGVGLGIVSRVYWNQFQTCRYFNNGCTFCCIYSFAHAIFACSAAAEEMALEMILTSDTLNKWIMRTMR